ncbi:MAG: DUF3147 family protein [Acidobacteriaceae bacterium]
MVEVKLAALRQTRPHEYLMRFLFGGAATVLAGLIAKKFGPGIGGLFLAFPAIFPASATLIEKHEKQRKSKIGHDGTARGRMAASIDAAGAAMATLGLCGFAIVLVVLLPRHNAALVIAAATAVWALVSVGFWELRKIRIFGLRACRRLSLSLWSRLGSGGSDHVAARKP